MRESQGAAGKGVLGMLTGTASRRGGEATAAPPARPKPRAGRTGVPGLWRLVLLEVAVALVLVGAVAGRTAPGLLGLTSAVAVAAVLVAAATVHHRGLPLPERSVAVLAMRRRQRQAATDPVGLLGLALAPLGACAPALRTYAFAGRSGRRVGMVGDGTFLTAVLVVRADDALLRAARPLPLGPLLDALEVEDVRLASVQVVRQVRAVPAPRPAPRAPSPDAGLPHHGIRATRVTWVALKLDPHLCPAAVLARGGGVGGAQRAVLRAADHLASRLVGEGFDTAVLDEEELIAALAASACLGAAEAAPSGTGSRRGTEQSRAWHCDGRRHTTYALGNAPAATRAVTALTSVPATACTFALALARGPGGARTVCGFLRLTTDTDAELMAACDALESTADRHGVEPARLDHEQVPGLLATMPLGGTR
ncbi:type VII secretion protein EccE [Streptomyces sp. NPDC021224]|uniref:type VII secretion protein EccE n=1 Tax=unclassified Streptomyces TaxID=2593676 RepID=UPI0037A31559